MLLGEEGFFLLGYSLQTSSFEVMAHSLGRERLVGDISKNFGNSHSSVSLPRTDKALCMANVGWRKLRRTTTTRFEKVRTMFRVKLRDCIKAIGSTSCYLGG